MTMRLQHLLITLLTLAVVGCSSTPKARNHSVEEDGQRHGNSVYYWKTAFELNDSEKAFLKTHQVKRLYLRLFDVVPADITPTNDYEVVPNATVAFREAMPEGVEIVPVVYITIDALRLINSPKHNYAEIITQRILNMADFHDLGNIREVQLDCDWTQQTQESYFDFCREVKERLEPYGIQLSCTIRLWQLACACPPVDRGVLMLYNTGSITNPETHNSILDLNDVNAYLKNKPYGLPLDYAFPNYSWYVWFRDNTYMGLFHNQPSMGLEAGDRVRFEHVSFDELRKLDSIVKLKMPGAENASIILYHLDSANLSNYTDDEIRQIFSHD